MVEQNQQAATTPTTTTAASSSSHAAEQQQHREQPKPSYTDAKATVQKLLGSKIICTLSDGRTIGGTLVCVDRLKNIILCDCLERRVIHSYDYAIENRDRGPEEQRIASRQLQQAMVPGNELVKVEIDRDTYERKMNQQQLKRSIFG